MERNMQLISLKQRKAKAASLILGLTAPLALSFAIPLAAAQDLAIPDSVGMSASRLALLDSNLQRYVDEAKLAGQA